MPPPREDQCHFPVKKNGRVVYCGKETKIIDPNTGLHLIFCSDHYRECGEAQKKIQAGHKDYPQSKFVAGGITIHK